MEIGEKKKIEMLGMSFEIQAISPPFYAVNIDLIYEKKQFGKIVTNIPKNIHGIKQGAKILMAVD